MNKFIKKNSIIEAVRWTGDNEEEIIKFAGKHVSIKNKKALLVDTMEGNISAYVGDWIIKSGNNFYPVSDEIFSNAYEKIIN